jgi:ubiquinone/menaquinone biosynthesis C-methylase UbiE
LNWHSASTVTAKQLKEHHMNKEQIDLWNGAAGQAWVDRQESLDRLFAPFERLLADIATDRKAKRVLDVGCGTGATTLAIARRLGAQAACTGVDISEPMVALARERAQRERLNARFVIADAQAHAFAPASFDLIVSRFGVMFFEDPIAALANLHRASATNAALRLIAWRSAADNPFMTAAERAAAPYLPAIPARKPDEPGQFGFADANRVRSILEQSGWKDVANEPLDLECTLPASELDAYVTKLGPLGRVLGDADERTRAEVLKKVRAAFAPYVHGEEVRFNAACWLISAKA